MAEVFVARQPIFYRNLKVAGYELLFRGGPTSEAFVVNPEGATASVVLNSFTEIGLEIKKKSPLKRTFTVSLANGYNGYLPTPAQHVLGGYETWRVRSSYLETKASDTITPTVLELLKQVAK